MQIQRFIPPIALVSAAMLFATACATSDSPSDTEDAPRNFISYATEQEFAGYNNDTAESNSVANAVVLNQVLPYFTYYDAQGTVQYNTDVGTIEQVSDEPLTVQYTINDDAVWSDGTPITVRDYYLSWAAESGNFDGFRPVSTAGTELIAKPTEDPDSKSFTVVYESPWADWEVEIGSQNGHLLPAHVVERETGVDIAEAVANDDAEAMESVAEFWNSAWSGWAPGQLPDESLIPSGGPYKIGDWQAGQYITLEKNENYWGTPASNDGITIRFIDQEAQVQALQNGDVDVIEPQPNVDLMNQIGQLGDEVVTITGPQITYDHLDFNLDGKFANRDLREALAYCLPRQEIVDKLIKPVDENAEVLNASRTLPMQEGYDDIVSDIAAQFSDVDLDAAREAVARSGETDLSVNAVYLGNPNQRRQNTMEVIEASCGQVGFEFSVRALTPQQWGEEILAGNFDIAQFAWSGSGGVTQTEPLYRTGSDQNYMNYTNPEVDALLTELSSTADLDRQVELSQQLEDFLWTDLPTIPLFAWPALVAHRSTISGVELNATQTQSTYKASTWERN